MKYSNEIIVELPLDEFIKKLDNADNMKHWQEGLTGYEYIEGSAGEVGAKMKLSYKIKKREMDLIETILHKNLPNEFHMSYDTKGMHNIQKNYFEETPEGHTKWISHAEFVPGNFAMKLMSFFMKGAFKKQSLKYLNDFKNFAEKGVSVNQK